MSNINEIRALFDDARATIATLDQELAAERSTIRKTAFLDGRPLTPDEITRRKELAATRTELADALETLAESTINSIETDEGLKDVIHAVQSVNLQLEDDLDRLRKVERHAQNAASVAAGLTRVVDLLVSLHRPTA